MIRLVVFLILVGVLALGAGWVADQDGAATFVWQGWRIQTSLPVVAFMLVALIAIAIMVWILASALWHLPRRLRERALRRRETRGRAAIAAGLIAIGEGDSTKARKLADKANRLASQDSLSLLLAAQAAQLAGDHDGAQRAFRAMAGRQDTRLLGLRGLFIEAQRIDAPLAALAAAEEAVKIAPSSAWAAQALLGFRCAAGDWQGALSVLESNHAAGQLDRDTYRRQRAVLLTAQALDDDARDRDHARAAVMEAVSLAPTLIPAATLAARFHAEDGNVRKAMKAVVAAWRANPHPDLADAYMHVRLGDSARERLSRAEALAAMTPGHVEGALAVARAAIDASDYAKARAALEPFLAAPTQRVAMLMAEIERGEHGDTGKSRQWTLRAVRAALDPAWTADGFVSDRWRPVSPLTGRLDAFHWATPVAALPGGAPPPLDAEAAAPLRNAEGPGPARPAIAAPDLSGAPPAPSAEAGAQTPRDQTPSDQTPPVQRRPDRGPAPAPSASPAAPLPAGTMPTRALFRDRSDLSGPRPAVPPVIPVLHAPDDPGVDDGESGDEAAPEGGSGQPGGLRGALARWMG